MTIIPIVFGLLGTVIKLLVKGREEFEIGTRVETNQTTALLRSAKIRRESQRLEETFCHSNYSKTPSADGSMKISKRTRTCKIVDFAVPADHRIKLKECEKKDKYLDLARELKKLRNVQGTIIPVVIGAFGTVTNGLLKGLEDLEVGRRVETIQTTALLRRGRILRRVLETWGDLLSLRLQWKTIG